MVKEQPGVKLATDEQMEAVVRKYQAPRDQFPVPAPDAEATLAQLNEQHEQYRPDPPLTPEAAHAELLELVDAAFQMINTPERTKTAQGIVRQYSQAAFRGQAISSTWSLFERFNLSEKLYRLQFGEIGNDSIPGERPSGLDAVKKRLAKEFVAKLTAAGYTP